MKAQVGHEEEGERTTREECVEEKEEEDTNSMHDESHVSNRHMDMGWQNAWWVRVNNGLHLRMDTVEKCGEQPQGPRTKCATRERVAGGERENRRVRENREKRKQRLARRLPLSHCNHCNNRSSRRQQLQRQCACNDAHGFHRGMVDNETFYDIGHRNVDFMDSVQRVRRSDAGCFRRDLQ